MGPLAGVRILEFAGIGPVPFAGMLLSDMGADVVRVDRELSDKARPSADITSRGRRAVALNLKDSAQRDQLLGLIDHADVVIEGFRPLVMERLGLGPDVLLTRN